MAFNAPMSFLLAILSLFAAANLVHAQLLPPIRLPPLTLPPIIPPILPNISLININGTLCCTPTGACPGTPLVNQTVGLVCPTLLGGNTTIGTGITSSNGTFTITITNPTSILSTLLGGISGCRATVNLPSSPIVCPVLSTTGGSLTSFLSLLSTVIDSLNRAVLSFTTPNFSLSR